MAGFEVLEGERRPSVRETVEWHLHRLKGMDIWDKVLFTDEDGATERGIVLDHERDIQNSEDGTVSIGGHGEALRIPVQSIIRVTVRIAEQISAKTPTGGREIDEERECFYVDPLGREVRRGVGTVFGGRQEASGERVPTYGHGEIVGGAGGRKRRVADGQISGRNDNVVYARFGKNVE